MLPEGLIALQKEYYEDDIIFLPTKAGHVEEAFSIDFTIMLQNEHNSNSQDWNVTINGYRKSKLTFEPAYEIAITQMHPLLWAFTDMQAALYYNGKIDNSKTLLYDLYSSHCSLFKQYVPFTLAEELAAKQSTLFSFSNGLLTSGPRQLMEEYGKTLQKHGLEYSLSLEQSLQAANNTFTNDRLAVFLLGDSFVVGEKFVFKRMD